MGCCICSFFNIVAVVLAIGILLKIYIKLTTGWCKSHTCLAGKTAIVTGANTGIGYETALDFAKRGARVILACRDRKRAEEAQARIIDATGNPNVVVKIIDMASFKSVRAFAKDINDTEERLDILVNNAGVGGIADVKSEDGYLLVMQINYYSSFLLTNLLIGLLKKSGSSRIVNVASMAARQGKLDLDTLNEFPGVYSIYYNSKLCNVLFTVELAQRLKGTDVTTYSLHPGAVKTEIFRDAQGFTKYLLLILTNTFFKSSEEGAQTNIYTSVTKGIECFNGENFSDCQRIERYKTVNNSLARKLWAKTEEIVQLKPEELQF